MGVYINPEGMPKEDWLAKNGERLSSRPANYRVGTRLVVCLVENCMFTAAGIAFCQDELLQFTDPWDRRVKGWYLVEESLLREICPQLEAYMAYAKEA